MATLVGIKNPTVLANYLRNNFLPLTQDERDYLADYLEGKTKEKANVGRPNKSPTALNLRKMFALGVAKHLIYAWRKKYGRKHKVTLKNGKTYNLRKEAIRRATIRHNRSCPKKKVTEAQISEWLRLPKNRRH